METEIPAMFQARSQQFPNERFTFHSARMRMMHVTPKELKKMDAESDRCALELSDARCDVLGYACLVAIMSQGPRYHLQSEQRLSRTVAANNAPVPVLSSAGALVDVLNERDFNKVAIITPYMKPLTQLVVDYLEDARVQVTDSISLEVSDNLEVGKLDPMDLLRHLEHLDHTDADAVVLSACVQMPSLAAIQMAEDRIGKPVLSAAVATVYQMLKKLDLKPVVPNAGYVLSGKF
jgi:maleate isomerase